MSLAGGATGRPSLGGSNGGNNSSSGSGSGAGGSSFFANLLTPNRAKAATITNNSNNNSSAAVAAGMPAALKAPVRLPLIPVPSSPSLARASSSSPSSSSAAAAAVPVDKGLEAALASAVPIAQDYLAKRKAALEAAAKERREEEAAAAAAASSKGSKAGAEEEGKKKKRGGPVKGMPHLTGVAKHKYDLLTIVNSLRDSAAKAGVKPEAFTVGQPLTSSSLVASSAAAGSVPGTPSTSGNGASAPASASKAPQRGGRPVLLPPAELLPLFPPGFKGLPRDFDVTTLLTQPKVTASASAGAASSSVGASIAPALPRTASGAVDWSRLTPEQLAHERKAREKAYPVDDAQLQSGAEPPLPEPLPPRPTVTTALYGLRSDQFADALQVWDFLRTFGGVGGPGHQASGGPLLQFSAELCGEPIVVGAAAPSKAVARIRKQLEAPEEEDEVVSLLQPSPATVAAASEMAATLASLQALPSRSSSSPSVAGVPVVPLPSPSPSAQQEYAPRWLVREVAAAHGLPVPESTTASGKGKQNQQQAPPQPPACVTPSLAQFRLSDFIALLRCGTASGDVSGASSSGSMTWRAMRSLSRLHIGLLRLLIQERDELLDRVHGGDDDDSGDDGGSKSDGDSDNEEGGVGRKGVRGAMAAKARRQAAAEEYEAGMSSKEWELEVALGQMSPLTWPEVLRRAFLYGPLGAHLRSLVSDATLVSIAKLGSMDYASLPLSDRLVILRGLCDGVTSCGTVGDALARAAAEADNLTAERRRADWEDETEVGGKIYYASLRCASTLRFARL